MKSIPIICAGLVSLPLVSHSQVVSTAVIIVDENGEEPVLDGIDPVVASLTETDLDQDITDREITAGEPIVSETDQGAADIVEEQLEIKLEEQPEDLHLPVPTEPVLVKVSPPRQIEISDTQEGGFQLITPWAPKPMQQAPDGWRYTPAKADKAYPVEVKLSSGKTLSLNVRPYTLVPTISTSVIQAREPGYQPERGYQQTFSISARLESTTSNLKQAADSLDQSIQNLSSLVDSLPK